MGTFDRVSSGQPLRQSPARNSNWLNAQSAVGEWFQNTQALGHPLPTKGKRPTDTDLVRIRNLTGTDLSRGHVVQLGDFLLNEKDNLHLWFQGNLVADPVAQRLVILRQPTPQSEMGVAQASGVCIAKVDVQSTDHRYATPVDGAVVMKSAASGPVELLMVPTSTGEQELAVRIGSASVEVRIAKADEEITALDDDTPGSGTVSIYTLEEGDLVDTDENVEVLNIGSAVAADAYLYVVGIAGAWWVVQTGLGYDRCKAAVKGAFTSGDATFTVDNVVATRGTSPVESGSDELTVQNTFGWSGADNDVVLIEYDQDAENWVAYQLRCSS